MEITELIKPIVVQGSADVKHYTDEEQAVQIKIQNLLNDSWRIYNTHTLTLGTVGYLVYVFYKEEQKYEEDLTKSS